MKLKNRNVMLHVMNVFWLGGVPAFVEDMMRAYPQFHHVIAYIWEYTSFGTEDHEMMQRWEWEYGCDIGHVDNRFITPELMEEINPTVTILNCTRGQQPGKAGGVFGNPPYKWLWKWPRIFVHHMVTRPVVPAHLHVFVSEYMKKKFEANLKGMYRHTVCPPVINTDSFVNIPRSKDNKRCVIGKLSSDWNEKKYPQFYLNVIRELNKKYPDISFEIVGGEKHHGKTPGIKNLSMPAVMTKPVPTFLSEYDIFCYAVEHDFEETWCRAVSEAMAAGLPIVTPPGGAIVEQVDDEVNGFICQSEEEYIEKLSLLIESPELRYEIGMRNRQKAHANFGYKRLHQELDPTILDILTGHI